MARSPSAAITEHLRDLQSVAEVLRSHVSVVRGSPREVGQSTFVLHRGEFERLSGTEFLFRHSEYVAPVHEATHAWDAVRTGYSASFADDSGRELVAFHWHPSGRSHVTTPHAHVALRSEDRRLAGGHVHIPTPELTLARIVRFAIEEFGASPARTTWRRILRD